MIRVILKEIKEILGFGFERNGLDDKLVVESCKSCFDEWFYLEYLLYVSNIKYLLKLIIIIN